MNAIPTSARRRSAPAAHRNQLGGAARRIAALALLAGAAVTARAQHLLAVVDDNHPAIVVAARDIWPEVMENGKLHVVHASRYALVDRGEFLPAFVAVRHPEVKMSSMTLDGAGDINRECQFYCDLETAYALDNVFVVLAVRNDQGERGIFLFEVGRLEPRHSRQMNLTVPMNMENAPGRYELYLFSGGREVFQSMMPIGAMEAALNHMVAARIRGVRDALPQPFVGPQPEYPRSLLKKKISGTATIAFTLDDRGRPWEAKVVAATRPEFGESALAAIKDWRFLPKVERGAPVETKAELPFNFAPPEEK